MRAAVLHAPGPPGAFAVEEVPIPSVGPDDVLVRVGACGVSFRDVVERNGTYRRDTSFPAILGLEIAGTVVEGRITSLRRVDWGSMRVNFFVMFPRAEMPELPATYISALRAPAHAQLAAQVRAMFSESDGALN